MRKAACACICALHVRAYNKKGTSETDIPNTLFTCYLRGFFGLRNSVEIIISTLFRKPKKPRR